MSEVQTETNKLVESYLEKLTPGKRTIYTGLVPVLDSILYCSQYLMKDQFGQASLEINTEDPAKPFFDLILKDLNDIHGLVIPTDSPQFAVFKNQVYTFYSDCLVSKAFETQPKPMEFDAHKRDICALYCRRFTQLTEAIEILRGFNYDETILASVENSIRNGEINNEFRFSDLWNLVNNSTVDNSRIKMECTSSYHLRLIDGIHMSETALGACWSCVRAIHNGRLSNSADMGCGLFVTRMLQHMKVKKYCSHQLQPEPIELIEQTPKPKRQQSSLLIFSPEYPPRNQDKTPDREKLVTEFRDFRANWIINLYTIIERYKSWKETQPRVDNLAFLENILPTASRAQVRLINYILGVTERMDRSSALWKAVEIWDRNVQVKALQELWDTTHFNNLVSALAGSSDNPFDDIEPREIHEPNLVIDPTIMLNIELYHEGNVIPILFPIKLNRVTFSNEGGVKIYSYRETDPENAVKSYRPRDLLIGNAAMAAVRFGFKPKNGFITIPFHDLRTGGFSICTTSFRDGNLIYADNEPYNQEALEELRELLVFHHTGEQAKNTGRVLNAIKKGNAPYHPKTLNILQRRSSDSDPRKFGELYVQDRLF